MVYARQFFKGILKKDKVYPWTLAKLVKASGGGSIEDYLNGKKSVPKAENAAKVNNHTVEANVPAGALFTDTVFTHPTSAGNKHLPAGGSTNQILKYNGDGTAVWSSIIWEMIANGIIHNVKKGAFVTNTGGSDTITINTGLTGDNVIIIAQNGDWQAAYFTAYRYARVGANNPNFYVFLDAKPTVNIRIAWIAVEF